MDTVHTCIGQVSKERMGEAERKRTERLGMVGTEHEENVETSLP